MATARREQARTLAINIGQCLSVKGKVDWDAFVTTGQLADYQRPEVPPTPLYLARLARMKAIRDGTWKPEDN